MAGSCLPGRVEARARLVSVAVTESSAEKLRAAASVVPAVLVPDSVAAVVVASGLSSSEPGQDSVEG